MRGIAAVTLDPSRFDIFYLQPDFTMAHQYWGGSQFAFGYDLGDRQFVTVPAAVATRGTAPVGPTNPTTGKIVIGRGQTPRYDVFAVGTDYAMYQQTVWDDDPPQSLQWTSLGGAFTSAPAALAWQSGRIDLFGLDLGRALVRKVCSEGSWSNDWENLGGTLSSVPSLVSWGPDRLDVFVRGADFTLRHRAFSAAGPLTDWENLGGKLASAPSATTWGPNRLDVFAVMNDGALWHRWWDGKLWNEWEKLTNEQLWQPVGGSFSSDPSAVSSEPDRLDVAVTGSDGLVYEYAWFDEIWHGPGAPGTASTAPPAQMSSSPTMIAVAPNILYLVVPSQTQSSAHKISWEWFNGVGWGPPTWGVAGGELGLPTRYRFGVDFVNCLTARSLNNDSDMCSATLGLMAWPVQTVTQWIPTIGGTAPGQAETNLLEFDPVTFEMCEVAGFNYLVVNNGHASQVSLTNGITSAAQALLSAGLNALLSSSIVGSIGSWLLGQFGGYLFADCDGVVAVRQVFLTGRDMQLKTTGGQTYNVTDDQPGTSSPTGCGATSMYTVQWSVRASQL